MQEKPVYEALADAFVAEGVDTVFSLLGDGNMHWCIAMSERHGTELLHVRHEHCAIGAAMGYNSATGKTGVASVTCGPGFTQTMTALTSAARDNVPVVVFAGETPLSGKWHQQSFHQPSLAEPCGARYIEAHSIPRMHDCVRKAFYVASYERRPVVLGVPYDLQKQPAPADVQYQPSSSVLPGRSPVPPAPEQVNLLVELLTNARCPIIVAGRGVLRSGARQAVEDLADLSGAMLATTLAVRGLYDHSPHALGVCGGYSPDAAGPVYDQADLVLAFGASLSYHTLSGGRRFPRATVVQIDPHALGLHHGLKSADHYVRADALLTATAVAEGVKRRGQLRSAVRSPALSRRLREEPADATPYPIDDGTLDPRQVFRALEDLMPKDYDVVSGNGHQAYFHTTMRGFDGSRYHMMRGFGAIGNGISYALGVAAARRNGRVVLFEGDGGLTMHIQEFETLRRHNLKVLIVCCNDGGYGAEIHKLRVDGLPEHHAVFGRPDFASIARGFGLAGATVTSLDQLPALMHDYEASDRATVWDVHVSDRVANPVMREAYGSP